MKFVITKFIFLLLVMIFIVKSAHSMTLFWGSEFNDNLYDSTGNDLSNSFQFELGRFDTTGGWSPTAENLEEWASHWILFDRATAGDGFVVSSQYVAGWANHNLLSGSDSPEADEGSLFPEGSKAYLWIFNTKTIGGTAEWMLAADSDTDSNLFSPWYFPDPQIQGEEESADWQFRDLDEVVYGGLKGVQGPGSYTEPPGSYTIQTHAVPEPGTVFGLYLAAGGWLLRRRKPVVEKIKEIKGRKLCL